MAETVAEAAGRALARAGVRTVFGVVGSGNFHLTNALTRHGARFIAARHEGGAAVMADAYARVTGELGVLSVHQGPGLTNAVTGITEAAKSRTPLLVLAPEATSPLSNFYIDQAALALAVGARAEHPRSPDEFHAALARAVDTAVGDRRTVIVSLPLDIQAQQVPQPFRIELPRAQPDHRRPDPGQVSGLADALAAASRPVFIAGRGARAAGPALRQLAGQAGALLATSAVARGLFHGDPFSLDVSGGFATPLAAELIRDADLVVGWGCALNMWTLRHGTLVGKGATVVQVDTDPAAVGAHTPVGLGVIGDAGAVAEAVRAELTRRIADNSKIDARTYRTAEVAGRIASQGRWRDVPFEPAAEDGRIDPRTLTIALDDILPAERTVATDSGNFMGYPAAFLAVPDEHGLVFTQAFQSIGLGLATAIGAAIARPDRLTIAALGDGGALMGISEVETAVRLGLGLLIVVYNDEAYGAEVHHFGPDGYPLEHVRFPETDIASIARGFGAHGVTVRAARDLDAVRGWLDGPRARPMLVDAKVTTGHPSWWLEEAFRGH